MAGSISAKKVWARFAVGADSRPTAREDSSKPTAAYLGARAPAEAASARDRRARAAVCAIYASRSSSRCCERSGTTQWRTPTGSNVG